MKRAIFLDRDGTINEDIGYFCSMDKFKLIPKAVNALRLLHRYFDLFIVTNQSGVARKIFSESDLISFNRQIEEFLFGKNISIKKTYYCPHLPKDLCHCHKPSPYFLKEAAKEYCIDLKQSFVIGDHPHDVEMAAAVGAKSVYVLTGHGEKHKSELKKKPDCLAADIFQASCWIQSFVFSMHPASLSTRP
jgi:D-glycero-D-manno-heptose 1,7-bisphosphate phosphatase